MLFYLNAFRLWLLEKPNMGGALGYFFRFFNPLRRGWDRSCGMCFMEGPPDALEGERLRVRSSTLTGTSSKGSEARRAFSM